MPGPREGGRESRRVVVPVAIALGVVALALAVFVVYVRGGGPAPQWAAWLRAEAGGPLAPSGPAETVLRTMRLAGIERAAVGDQDGAVVLRVELPRVRTDADVALAWQTGMAAIASAYPSATSAVVQVFSGSQSLLEVGAPLKAVRAALDADDATGLRRACTVRYLPEAGGG